MLMLAKAKIVWSFTENNSSVFLGNPFKKKTFSAVLMPGVSVHLKKLKIWFKVVLVRPCCLAKSLFDMQ